MVRRRTSVLWVLALAMAITTSGAWGEEPPWRWSTEEIEKRVGRVRAGRDLTPESWPGGARVAVGLSFDVDTEPLWFGFAGQASPSYMSRGEYGARVGMPRILRLLDEKAIPATFFVPAASLTLHPEIGSELRARPRHELGFHSFIHENPLQLEAAEERSVYEKALAIVTEAGGRRPVGFRSAAWDLSSATIDIVRDLGFLYDSSLMADDRPYELVADGKPTSLVELPVEWILDDWPYFQLVWSMNHQSLRRPSDVYEIWKAEFDVAYEEGTTFILVMHPQVIGHRHRMPMLARLIDYMKSRKGVWFATHEDIVRHVLEEAGTIGEASQP